jgi:hypothetical protein
MADTIGGSIESVSWFGREFAVAADADANKDLGGFEAEDLPNGNGTTRYTLTRKNWRLEGVALELNDDNGDQEFLQEKIDARQAGPFAVTEAGGQVYQGNGKLVGELRKSTQSVTAPVAFAGGGKLTKQ